MTAANQVKSIVIAALVCLSMASNLSSQTFCVGDSPLCDTCDHPAQVTVSLALSGGGARGIASIGILKAFAERQVPVAAVAGTSIGGVISGLFACGYTPQQIESIFRDINWDEIFQNKPDRRTMFLTQRQDRDKHLLSLRFQSFRPSIPKGITEGQKLISLLTTLTISANYRCGGDFDRLKIPWRTVATDVATGKLVVFDSGSISDAMRATIAFPLAFTGLDREGHSLMDGGMLMPVPVTIARSMSDSAAIVVAINTSSPLLPAEKLATPVHVANQVTTIMTADKMAEQLSMADLVITPAMDDLSSTDFDHIDSLIALGYREGMKACDSIFSLLNEKAQMRGLRFSRVVSKSPQHDSIVAAACRSLTEHVVSSKDVQEALEHICGKTQAGCVTAGVVADSTVDGRPVSSTLIVDISPGLSSGGWMVLLRGASIVDSTELFHYVPPMDEFITRAWTDSVCRSIERLYSSRGYDLAAASVNAIDTVLQRITITIDEAIIQSIDVSNTTRCRPWQVRSLYSQQQGESVSTRKLTEGMNNIVGTDYFDRVSVHVIPSDRDSGGVRVRFDLEEKLHSQMRFGWHWDDDYQSEEFLEFLDDNISGVGLYGVVHGRYAMDRQLVYGLLRADRIAATPLTAAAGMTYSRLERRLYSLDGNTMTPRLEKRVSAELALGRQMSRLGTVSGKVSAERVILDSSDAPAVELDIRKISFVSEVENFDKLPFTETGKRHLFTFESAGKVLGGNTEFTRFHTSVEAFFPLTALLNYHPRLAIGVSRSNLPLAEKFFVGGLREFSGYRQFELVGDKVMLSSHELRVRLASHLYVGGRYDFGNVYASADQISFSSLRHGVGLWAGIETPIGPILCGWGKASHTPGRAYMHVGLSF